MTGFYCTAKARIAHEYNPLDPRMPMRAKCGHKELPQNLILASTCGNHQDRPFHMADPIYCPRCLA
jgi:hypothetical protein